MKRSASAMTPLLAVLFILLAVAAAAELRVNDAGQAEVMVAGRAGVVRVAIQNPTPVAVENEIFLQIFQLSSSTRMPLGPAKFWKKLNVGAGQTVLEEVPMELPAVRALTRFELRWLEAGGTALGQTVVFGSPTEPLRQLSQLAGPEPIIVAAAEGKFSSLLRDLGVAFDSAPSGSPRARLAIFFLESPGPELIERRAREAKALARRGCAVIWLAASTTAPGDVTQPVAVHLRDAAPIVTGTIPPVETLRASATAQLNLLRLAELALKPDAWAAPPFFSDDKL